MSIATYISSIESNRNTIRNKLIELGLAASTDKLDALATAIEGIINQGAVSVTVQEGSTYTIPAGYHNGSGTVSGVSGGGNYTLQSKTATPTKKQQSITPDSGYYGLSDVTVSAIPEAYQDVSSVTATSADVLTGKVIVLPDGTVQAGEMTNNGAVNKTLDATTITYTVPSGYHSGTGTVKIVLETKSVTPTKETQNITPTAGKVLSKVTVNPIPAEYITTADATATDASILDGETAYVGGEKITGTMTNNGAVSKTLDATTNNQTYTVPGGYHSGTGTVKVVLETKTATPTKSSQDITPTSGKLLSKVTVNPIPASYIVTTDATAKATDILASKTAYVNGVKVTGSITNNGSVSTTIDGLTTVSTSIPEGYTTGGTVSLTDDIENALAAI